MKNDKKRRWATVMRVVAIRATMREGGEPGYSGKRGRGARGGNNKGRGACWQNKRGRRARSGGKRGMALIYCLLQILIVEGVCCKRTYLICFWLPLPRGFVFWKTGWTSFFIEILWNNEHFHHLRFLL